VLYNGACFWQQLLTLEALSKDCQQKIVNAESSKNARGVKENPMTVLPDTFVIGSRLQNHLLTVFLCCFARRHIIMTAG
jgi:hypothetical protein